MTAISQLIEITKSSSPSTLRDFQAAFDANRETINLRRDSSTRYFLKMILSILTFRIANIFGLWKMRGQEVTQDMSSTLNEPEAFAAQPG